MICLDIIFTLLILIAIGSGIFLVFGLLRGRLENKSAIVFLRYSLAANVMGLLLPLAASSIHSLSFLTVYVSGLAILAWRRFHLAGQWRSVFAFAMTAVLGLDVLTASSQVWSFVSHINGSAPETSALPQMAMQLPIAAFFVVLGIVAIIKFQLDSTSTR